MALKAKSASYRPEVISKPNFLIAAANNNGNFDLPTGFYDLYVYGTHNNTDDTFKIDIYVDEAQSAVTPLPCALYNGANFATPLTLATDVIVSIYFAKSTDTDINTSFPGIPVPHGLKWTYTKGSATAVNMSLLAIRRT